MTMKALTDVAARNARPKTQPYKLSTGGGLYLEVMPNGAKYWRMKYRHAGREKRLAIGVYPELSLKRALVERDRARLALYEDRDPSGEKKVAKLKARTAADDSFKNVRSEEHTSELQTLMRNSYAVFTLKKKHTTTTK